MGNMIRQKKIIKSSLVFLLILVSLIFIINFLYIKLIVEKEIIYQKEEEYQNFISRLPDKTIEFGFFGSSHTLDAINPNYIPNSYNFAFGGENYVKTYYRLKKVLEIDNIKIKNIIFEIDIQTFLDVMVTKDHALVEHYPFSEFVSILEIWKISKDYSLISIFLEWYFPVIGKGEDFKYLYLKDFTKIDKGWISRIGDFTKTDMNLLLKQRYDHYFSNKQKINKISMEYFIKTIKLAKLDNINIIFIKTPVTKEFDGYMVEKNVTKEEYYDEIYNKINLSIGTNYKILDYYNIFFNESYYFHDPDHLNEEGAAILSKKVYNNLKKEGNININFIYKNQSGESVFN